MDTGLRGRTVLITGASRNIGRLAAIAFAREGANLAICTSSKLKQKDVHLKFGFGVPLGASSK